VFFEKVQNVLQILSGFRI